MRGAHEHSAPPSVNCIPRTPGCSVTSAVNRSRAGTAAKKTVGFKFSDDRQHEAFVRLAASRGKSPGLYAQEICVQALRAGTAPSVAHPDLARELAEIRKAMAQSVLVLLVRAGNVSEREALQWVSENWLADGTGGVR